MKSVFKKAEDYCSRHPEAFGAYLEDMSYTLLTTRIALIPYGVSLYFACANGWKYGADTSIGYIAQIVLLAATFAASRSAQPPKQMARAALGIYALLAFAALNYVLLRAHDLRLTPGSGSVLMVLTAQFFCFAPMRIWAYVVTCFSLAAGQLILIQVMGLSVSAYATELFLGTLFGLMIGLLTKTASSYSFYNRRVKEHILKQSSRALLPHQLEILEAEGQLEDTMPVGSGEATVICVDFIKSSSIDPGDVDRFARLLQSRCKKFYNQRGQGQWERHAYPLNFVGDGLFLTVGYPFTVPKGTVHQQLALQLAKEILQFMDVIRNETGIPLHCGIGLASGPLTASWVASEFDDSLEYSVVGRCITTATRIESFRKKYFRKLGLREHDAIFLEDKTGSACALADRSAMKVAELQPREGYVVENRLEEKRVFVLEADEAVPEDTRACS